MNDVGRMFLKASKSEMISLGVPHRMGWVDSPRLSKTYAHVIHTEFEIQQLLTGIWPKCKYLTVKLEKLVKKV